MRPRALSAEAPLRVAVSEVREDRIWAEVSSTESGSGEEEEKEEEAAGAAPVAPLPEEEAEEEEGEHSCCCTMMVEEERALPCSSWPPVPLLELLPRQATLTLLMLPALLCCRAAMTASAVLREEVRLSLRLFS
jgi:hypothetical protein